MTMPQRTRRDLSRFRLALRDHSERVNYCADWYYKNIAMMRQASSHAASAFFEQVLLPLVCVERNRFYRRVEKLSALFTGVEAFNKAADKIRAGQPNQQA